MSSPSAILYVAVSPDLVFSLDDLKRKKRDVVVSETDKRYGNVQVKKVEMHIIQEALDAHAVVGWVVQNPDETFWWDTLASSLAETQAWMTRRREQMLALGFKTVCAEFKLAN